MEWMLMPLRRYADFKGRSRRKEFWLWVLLNMIVMTVFVGLFFATGGYQTVIDAGKNGAFAVYGAMFSGFGLLFAVWGLVTLVPNIAVTVRRLHDRDLSGWWYLAVVLLAMIPYIGGLVNIGFLVLMCLEGTHGPNRFGPDPRETGGAMVFA
ncbi:DUF805 domain-containing protein [Novosphingobium sp. KCTC 2891]|uniref:DUF805 domain-containing protein n=1 Tax=Novosphingobium sp. KCTC 2891 TaxID=2989730 RepID=UPI002222D6EC|nr:DUF805 domain-containing protein [Novosphingobium sp. KCTC 2891]MCW1381534.1 DUF805 domain-containing protein [Novosphingobium sp. KCTC 2891]